MDVSDKNQIKNTNVYRFEGCIHLPGQTYINNIYLRAIFIFIVIMYMVVNVNEHICCALNDIYNDVHPRYDIRLIVRVC